MPKLFLKTIRIRIRDRIRNSLKSRIRIRDRIRKKSFQIHNTADPGPVPLQSDGNLQPLIIRPSWAPFWASRPPFWASRPPFWGSMAEFWASKAIEIDLIADPDSSFHSYADPDWIQLLKIMLIHADPDPQPWFWKGNSKFFQMSGYYFYVHWNVNCYNFTNDIIFCST